MPRFVILRHDALNGTHFDLMLEAEGILKTWSLPQPPAAGKVIDCEALPDHRLAYLDYEGPISGERGSVTRWDAGVYVSLDRSDNEWQIEFSGERLRGTGRLLREAAGTSRWRFSLRVPPRHGS